MGAARVPNRVVAAAIDAPTSNRREGADDDDGRITTVESAPAHPGKNVYARPDNPTYVQVEAVIAALDGGVGCALFSSGWPRRAAWPPRCSNTAIGVFPRHRDISQAEYFRQHCARIGCEFRLYDCRKGKAPRALERGRRPEDGRGAVANRGEQRRDRHRNGWENQTRLDRNPG